MAALPKSPLVVRFGKLDQKRSSKSSILGTMKQAINVRQRELGRYSKRYGYSVINRTATSGTIADAIALGTNAGSAILQTSDSVYVRDTAGSTWRNKGAHAAVMPGVRELVFPLYGSNPSHATTSGITWMFARNTTDGFYYYRVVNATTGVEIVGPTKLDASSVFDVQGKPVVAGGFVWFLYATDEGADYMIDVAKFDPANPTTAPVITHFHPGGGASLAGMVGFDAYLPTGGTNPLVLLYGQAVDGGVGTGDVWTAYMNATTGAAIGAVHHDYTGLVSAGCILRGASGTGTLWIAFVTAAQNLVLKSINETTLASIADVTLQAGVATTLQGLMGYFSGVNKVVFLTNATAIETALVTRYNRTTTTTTSTVFARGQYVASEPFQVSSSWYVITGHDDGAANNLQRAYYLRDASSLTTANILARALYGLGGDVFQRGGVSASLFGGVGYDSSFATTVTVSGTTVTALLNGNVGGAADYGTYKTTWSFAPSLGSALPNVDEAETVIPGGWPKHIVAEALLAEFGLPMFPRAVTVSLLSAGGTLTDGTYSATALYARPDRRGNIMRSTAATAGTAGPSGSNDGIRVVVPTLRTINSNSDVVIEVYLTAPNGSVPFLVKTVANDPTADTVTVDITTNPTFGEALYTGGGVLSNYPVPPFRGGFLWNNRFWVFGTEHDSEAWHSKEFASGISPEWAPPLKVTTYGGSGSLLAGGVINSDYAVLFKRDALFAITGQGPDDTGGGGSFQTRRISWDGGCTNHASVVNYPGGLLFQGLDGVIYRVNSGLAVDDIGADANDYAAGTVTKAIHLPKDREVRFYLSTGTILVLDYGQANENAPNGYWYLDDSDTFGAATGAIVISDLAQFVDSTGVVWVEASGQYFDGTTTQILQKLQVNTVQAFDLGGEGRLSSVQFIGEWVSTHDLRLAIAVDGGSATNYDKSAVSAAPEDVMVRPGGAGRMSAVDITVEERGTGTGAGFSFDGLLLEVQSRSRGKKVNSGQRI